MLRDTDREQQYLKEREKTKQYKDLAYDIESYLIDLMYASSERIEDSDALLQENEGRRLVTKHILTGKESEKVQKCLCEVMVQMGIPRNIKGFRILQDCVEECVKQRINNKQYMLKDVYPVLAQKHNITDNNAEKLCRYACTFIDTAKVRENNLQIYGTLGRRTVENITLREVVDVLVDYVVKKNKFKHGL